MSTGTGGKTSLSARLLILLVALIIGAAAMAWALAHFPRFARTVGVNPPLQTEYLPARALSPALSPPQVPQQATVSAAAEKEKLDSIEDRLNRVEGAAEQAEGSADRANALVIVFAARRAVDRGVALGYLEPLLNRQFGAEHKAAVATVVTAARNPIKLSTLVARFDALEPTLRRGDPKEGFWAGFRRELGDLVKVRRTDSPSPGGDARVERARQALMLGNVDQALAETMRMPGAIVAGEWIADARRYVATQRALDELESAALLGNQRPR